MSEPAQSAHPPGPDNAQVSAHLAGVARRHADRASLQIVARTAADRPIEAIVLTDPRTDPADKQHVLVVAGQHGNEETARRVALRLIDHLLSTTARTLLERQTFGILPNLSPDAAAHDSYTTPAGIKPNLDHATGGAVSPEARAFESIARQWQPELYVDLHARGHAG
ncbi:MAG TPA: M14 family zinc carboxypeptidase, partial [Tepidisphaeraceae bacterium]|nr:M14 family zinc carboxypeptidase [Tepidisphaeraceae bacterium]